MVAPVTNETSSLARSAARPWDGAARVRAARAAAQAAAFLAAVALLCAPALWNGYPLLQYDTGGYLARYYERTLELSRSTTFGLYLHLGEAWHFWPNVVLQAALGVWLVALVLRALRLPRGPAPLVATVALLAVATTLPFLTSILLTDLFAGASVLALHLLLFHAAALRPVERAGLTLLVAFAASTHSATLAVLLAILAAAALARAALARIRPDALVLPWARVLHGFGAIALGALMLLGANYTLSGKLAWTPGGYGLSFGRMLQDGIVARYLDAHCPDPALRLCAYRDRLPATADEFFWGDSVFNELGRFQGMDREMRRIVLGSLVEFPLMQLRAALAATARQLAMVATGEGANDRLNHTYGIVERYLPGEVPAMQAARQQQGRLGFDAINRLHVPVALAASILVLLLVPRLRRDPQDGMALLAATLTVATLANAAILAIVSGPHDRYGARLAWLPVLLAILWALERWKRREARGGSD